MLYFPNNGAIFGALAAVDCFADEYAVGNSGNRQIIDEHAKTDDLGDITRPIELNPLAVPQPKNLGNRIEISANRVAGVSGEHIYQVVLSRDSRGNAKHLGSHDGIGGDVGRRCLVVIFGEDVIAGASLTGSPFQRITRLSLQNVDYLELELRIAGADAAAHP